MNDIATALERVAYDTTVCPQTQKYLLDALIKSMGGIEINNKDVVKYDSIYQFNRLLRPTSKSTIHLEVKIGKPKNGEAGNYRVSFDIEQQIPKPIREKVLDAVREFIKGTPIVEQKSRGKGGRVFVSEGDFPMQGKSVIAVRTEIKERLYRLEPLIDIAQEVIDNFTE